MTGADSECNHIITIHQADYQNFMPIAIHYTHSIALPEDGQYGHGVRQGRIEILDPSKDILDQTWIENERTGQENPTVRASEGIENRIAKAEVVVRMIAAGH